MNDQQTLSLDWTKEEDVFKFAPNPFFSKLYNTELPGKGLVHAAHPACEYREYYSQQHSIVVHLKPEYHSLRRMGDSVEVENVNVGDMAIIPANVNHWQRIDAEVSGAIILTIEPDIISNIARETVNPDSVELLPTFAKPDALIQGIALSLKANLDSGAYDKLYAESLFNAFSMHLLTNYCTRKFNPNSKESSGLAPFKLKQILDLIGDSFTEEVSTSQLANYLHMSQFHFTREFKKSVGVTPYHYIMQQRVKMAKRVLKQQDASIAEVAVECGFSNQSHLGRVFKQHTGTTPKRFRDGN